MFKKLINIITIPLIFLVSFMMMMVNNFSSYAKGNDTPDSNMPMPTCYSISMPVEPENPNRVILEQQLESLEDLYSQKKIDSTTYHQRKQNILQQIQELK